MARGLRHWARVDVADHRPTDLDEARRTLAGRIERHRGELRRGVEELTAAVRGFTRPIAPVREAPALWLVGGFVLGLWLGSGGHE